ncbi:hypothetical protein CMO83_01920 [Candidatus Woesearchaeota archaeon]|jgi:mannose-6-phosphate isomerase-like protein (cupin superfamily)|nr:hypothetical protein [Candidatus Woesearchaeota archaeon]MDP6648149.1 hypothetical protein [Candidatus Woesearchaeota archaeon]|tara:strand:+ start:98892 stop:99935 length:1044 start_codon:yes stop_codon:yes gene_type:complete
MNIKKLYNKEDIKNFRNIIKYFETLYEEKWILDKLKKDVLSLKRGHVKKKDNFQRAKIARHFTENSQLLIYALLKYNKDKKYDNIINKLLKIKNSGELVLRENPILMTKPPVDVLKWEDMPVRYALNIDGRKELRKGFGLHTNPFNEAGLSITIAFTPANYAQLFHHHSVSEFSFNLDVGIIGFYRNNTTEKHFKINKEEVAYYKADTIHKLVNRSNIINRNISVKSDQAILKWKPYYLNNSVIKGYGKSIKHYATKKYKNYLIKIYKVKDKFYNYVINILKINPDKSVNLINKSALYMYVIDGKLKVYSNGKNFWCGKNDLIVVDPGIRFTIKSITKSRIYYVTPN